MKKRILSMLLALSLSLSAISATAFAGTNASQAEIKNQIALTSNHLAHAYEPSIVSYWNVMYVSLAGVNNQAYYDAYLQEVKASLDENNGKMLFYGNESMSGYAATIMALSIIGEDPTDFHGYSLLERLTDMGIDGIQAQTYASSLPIILWTLNAHAEEINDPSLEEAALNYLLTFFDGDGFSTSYEWEGVTYYSVDTTAMCISVLEMYYDTNDRVSEYVDKSIEWIDGKIADGTVDNVFTASKVLTAYSIMGGDLVANAQVNEMNLVEYLLSFKSEGTSGSFESYGDVNEMATYQALEALLSYDRMINGETHIYDLSFKSDEPIESEGESKSSSEVASFESASSKSETSSSSSLESTVSAASAKTGDNIFPMVSAVVFLAAAAVIASKKKAR